jgi:hypothetical protein
VLLTPSPIHPCCWHHSVSEPSSLYLIWWHTRRSICFADTLTTPSVLLITPSPLHLCYW